MRHQRRATEKWGFHPLKYHFHDLKITRHAQEAMQLADAALNDVDMTNIQKTATDPTPPTKPSIPILLLPDLLMQTNSCREGSWGSGWWIGCYGGTSDREQNGHRVSSQPSWQVSRLDGNIWSGNWPVLNAITTRENIDINGYDVDNNPVEPLPTRREYQPSKKTPMIWMTLWHGRLKHFWVHSIGSSTLRKPGVWKTVF